MAVQIVQGKKKQSFGDQIMQGFGNALTAGSKILEQQQNQKKQEQQYQEENENYNKLTGRNLSKNPKTREMEIEYALKGENELKNVDKKYKNKKEEFTEKFARDQKTNKELLSFADRLEMNNPNSPLHKTVADIYRLDVPLNQKSELVKTLTSGVDPFKVQQQQRLQTDGILRRYNSRIKEIDDEIKGFSRPNSADKPQVDALRQQRMALRNERDQLLDFRALNGMEEEKADEEDLKDDIDLDEEEEEAPRVMFDPNNKGHKAAAEKLYKQYKDKEKVRKILSKRFKGL